MFRALVPVTVVIALLGESAIPAPTFAATPAQRCAAVKRKAAGKAAKGLAGCDGKAVLKGVGIDLACVSHVGVGFARAWSRAERKGGCATIGDQLTVEDRIDAHDAHMQTLLGAGSGFGSRCSAGKVRDSGRAAFCFLVCASKAAKTGASSTDPSIARCTTKCAGKLIQAFGRAESRKDCRTTGDLAAASSAIGAFTDCISNLVGPNGSTPCAGPSTTTTTTNPGGSTTTTGAPASSTSSTTIAGGTTTTTTVTTVPSTTSTSMPPLTQCCIPSSAVGAFICVPETASDCTLDGGADVGPGSCTPDPCPVTTTSTTTSTTDTDPSTTVTTSSSSSSSSTLLACGGLFPACLGSCPPGEACTAANLLDPCVCAALPTSTTTTTLLACGGVFPVCLGSCPPGEECTAASALDPCACAAIPTSSTTTTTLLACGGVAPVCLGSCPVGQTCTGAALSPCSCQ